MITLKQQLYDLCLHYVKQRIDTAQKAIQIAQASANEETKSSAGDKYETGRAMMQLEIEKNTVQLNEAMKLKQVLDRFDATRPTTSVHLGSLVITDYHSYYLAISAGQLVIKNKTYLAIAPTSPIGMQLTGKQAGETFLFNGRTIKIEEVI